MEEWEWEEDSEREFSLTRNKEEREEREEDEEDEREEKKKEREVKKMIKINKNWMRETEEDEDFFPILFSLLAKSQSVR